LEAGITSRSGRAELSENQADKPPEYGPSVAMAE
jgi:hypothetical protein